MDDWDDEDETFSYCTGAADGLDRPPEPPLWRARSVSRAAAIALSPRCGGPRQPIGFHRPPRAR